MARNIEIKARISDFDAVLKIAKKFEDIREFKVLVMEDVFFKSPNARLKLRKIEGEGESQLIFYDRPDSAGPKLSDYCIAKIADTANLLAVLGKSMGIRGCVKKTRHLFVVGQTRIHLDRVEGLGDFLELEVVLKENQTESDGKFIVDKFINKLSVSEADLIDVAYMDLLISA